MEEEEEPSFTLRPQTMTQPLAALSRARSSRRDLTAGLHKFEPGIRRIGPLPRENRRSARYPRAFSALAGNKRREERNEEEKSGGAGGREGEGGGYTPCALSSCPCRFDGRGHPVS